MAADTSSSRVQSDAARVARAALASCERVPGARKPDPVLVASGVRRAFGGIVAVDVDHLEVQRADRMVPVRRRCSTS